MAKNGRLYATDVTLSQDNKIWIRFGFTEPADNVRIRITGGNGIDIDLGNLRAGRFADRGQALFWNRKDNNGDVVPDGNTSVILYIDGVQQDLKRFNLN